MNFNEECSKLGIYINKDIEDKFYNYYLELVRVNENMNLTNITELNDVYNKHFLDSLYLNKAIDKESFSLCDVGSGAGFPAIPLAITNSNSDIVIIDSLNKRINFLNNTIRLLGLDNVKAIAKRAEEAKEYFNKFDYVTARAVAKLNILLEICMPLVKLGGSFIAMKSINYEDELNDSKKAIDILGGKLSNIITYDLKDDAGKRSLIIINKVRETPNKYPRLFKKIKENPL